MSIAESDFILCLPSLWPLKPFRLNQMNMYTLDFNYIIPIAFPSTLPNRIPPFSPSSPFSALKRLLLSTCLSDPHWDATIEQQLYPASIIAMNITLYVPAARDTHAEVVGPLHVVADVGDCTHGVLDVLVDCAVYRYIDETT